VTPTTSLNNSEGSYVCGYLPSQISTTTTDAFVSAPLTVAELVQYSGTVVSDMKTINAVRSYPTAELSFGSLWLTVGASSSATPSDYGSLFVIMVGCAPGATLSIKVSLQYSLGLAKGINNLILASQPKMGLYTNNYLEYLRLRYPNIQNWPDKEIMALYQKVIASGTCSYKKLIKIDHDYVHNMTHHQDLTGTDNVQPNNFYNLD